LFTKLDEVDTIDELVNAPPRTGLPITWVTTGQQVPEDLEQPNDARVRELAAHGLSDRKAVA
jgi:flagellar biosynthesis protein FlhF